MGEVYRARDERLGRDIALKILPETVAGDPERLDRFAREARVLASLNHPNIAAIHGFEDATPSTPPALVLELVDGPTLEQHLRQGAMPIDRALIVARHIAAALDAAHERGIVHRDLKPANVKITADGTAKVLDFGIAKVLEHADPATAASTATRTASGTHVGIVIGTPAYMSPEQARGEGVDRRADIWAFGCVLFEMLTGTRTFPGHTVSEAIASVLSRGPDWQALPAATPPMVRRLLRRCLERDPRRRLRDIGDALSDLDDAGGGDTAPPRAPVTANTLAWLLAGLLATALAATLLWVFRTSRDAAPPGVVRTEVALPAGLTLVARDTAYPLALSADGTALAFVAERDGASEVYVRALSQSQPVRVASGSGELKPFFSPDGRWLAFASEDTLLKVEVTGGTAIRICRIEGAFMGGVWTPDDRIIWAARNRGLYSVAAGGGNPSSIPETEGAAWPHVTPDGTTLLFTADRAAIVRMPVSGGTRTVVARLSREGGTEGPGLLGVGGDLAQAQLVSSGFLVYGQSPGIVMALPIDMQSLTPTGAPLPVADPVERGRNGGAVYFAVSQTGLLVYAPTGRRHRLMWVDRHGVETPLATDPGDFRFPALSPDDAFLAVGMNDETRRAHVWLYDAARGTRTWLGMRGLSFAWSPDGQSFTAGDGDLVTVSTTPGVPRRILVAQDTLRPPLPPGTNPYPKSWSRDGRYLLFQADEEQVWVFDAATGQSRALLTDPNSMHPTFSPDGRWIAYASTASGRSEILVRSFPELAHVTQVSIDGGSHPQWSQSGREIVYRAGDAVMSAAVDVSGTIRVGRPVRLFAGHYLGAGHEPSFTVTRDGSRFLMIKGDPASRLDRLSVVQHYFEAAWGPGGAAPVGAR
jgi:Tol biopolymer transport system component